MKNLIKFTENYILYVSELDKVLIHPLELTYNGFWIQPVWYVHPDETVDKKQVIMSRYPHSFVSVLGLDHDELEIHITMLTRKKFDNPKLLVKVFC